MASKGGGQAPFRQSRRPENPAPVELKLEIGSHAVAPSFLSNGNFLAAFEASHLVSSLATDLTYLSLE